jgi:pimeloyl-ACP methyl ester carboxylesterase
MKPFRIDIAQSQIDDLHERISRTRYPSEVPGSEWSRGVPVAYLRELADYWVSTFDWHEYEARLNAYPQFVTEIDGQQIHFLHVRSPEPDATPMILTHGWPSSVAEFLEIVGPLSDPRAHGGDPADAVHLVIPSLPGFAFSGPDLQPGWNLNRIARAWAALMARLGYQRYVAQGTDWGSGISRELGVVDAERVIGVHVNYLMTFPFGEHDFDEQDKARLDRLEAFQGDLGGYMAIQSSRPQTLAYGLADSPVGQLAWIAEKFKEWSDEPVDRDYLLTTAMIYWLTNTASSSAQIYYEFSHSWSRPQESTTPMGVAVFPKDLVLPIRKLAEYGNKIVHWTEFDRGGHFAALEQPELLVGDIRTFVRSLR